MHSPLSLFNRFTEAIKQTNISLDFSLPGIAAECSLSMRGINIILCFSWLTIMLNRRDGWSMVARYSQTAQKYSDTAARLVRAGYGVYGIDHEGHGRSSGRRCYIPNFNDIVTDCSTYFTSICGMDWTISFHWVHRLKIPNSEIWRLILEKPGNREKKRFLYGISMGGSVALLLHRKKPTYWDGAVLLAPMCKVHSKMITIFLSSKARGIWTCSAHQACFPSEFWRLLHGVLVTHDIRFLMACGLTRSWSALWRWYATWRLVGESFPPQTSLTKFAKIQKRENR